MRFLVTLTAFAASAIAADTIGQVVTDELGDCVGKCMNELFQTTMDCGDPSSADSSSCYCSTTTDSDSAFSSAANNKEFQSCVLNCGTDDVEDLGSNAYDLVDQLQSFCEQNGARSFATSKYALAAGALTLLGFVL